MNKSLPSSSALLILGMHRSGTSVLTRVLNLLGVELSSNLLEGAKDNNETGFWEHQDIVFFHEALFNQFDHHWYDVHPLPENWVEHLTPSLNEELQTILTRDFSNSSFWGIKDPRLSLCLPLWKIIGQEKSYDFKTIIALRNPYDVALSLHKRDGFHVDHSLLLWAHYYLEILKHVDPLPSCFIQYESLLDDWQSTTDQIQASLSLEWPLDTNNIKGKVESFIQPDLQHNNASQDDPAFAHSHSDITNFINQLYHYLQTLTKDSKRKKQTENSLTSQYTKLIPLITPLFKQSTSFRKAIDDQYQTIEKATIAADLQAEKIQQLEEAAQELHTHLQITRSELHSLSEAATKQQAHINALEQVIISMKASTSWKLSAPLRIPGIVSTAIGLIRNHGVAPQLFKHIGKHGVQQSWRDYQTLKQELKTDSWIETLQAWSTPPRDPYLEWVNDYDTLTEQDKERIQTQCKSMTSTPTIAVVIPAQTVLHSECSATLISLTAQLYPYWECYIIAPPSLKKRDRNLLQRWVKQDSRINIMGTKAEAFSTITAPYIAFLDGGDELSPQALYMVAHTINAQSEPLFIYSDEDKLNRFNQRCDHYFKPDWNLELFLHQHYVRHLSVFKHTLIEDAGGYDETVIDPHYDLCLRALTSLKSEQIYHIPHILYHARSSYSDSTDTLTIKQEHFDKAYPGSIITSSANDNYHKINWPLPKQPSISIIIPTRDAYALIHTCVESILSKTSYEHYEIVIVDNQSVTEEALRYFKELEERNNIRLLRYNEPFNFSAINNFAVEQCESDLILFLNNDMEVITPSWLEEMASIAIRDGIGAVGAKLYYPNDTVQHAGIITGMGDQHYKAVAGHILYQLDKGNSGYQHKTMVGRETTAVTGACLMMPRHLFNQLGQFNASDLSVAFNDVDLCLRIREAGYKIIWTPHAELYHHESATRGFEDTLEKKQRFEKETNYMRKRWGKVLDSDPYYNPNLSLLPLKDYCTECPPRIEKPWSLK